MVKYEREEKNFLAMQEFHIRIDAHCAVQSAILFGWEIEELKRLLGKTQKNAKAVISELDNLLAMIKRRRTQ